MSQARELNEEVLLDKVRRLSSDKKQEVLDFVEFLASRDRTRDWLEFDEWALDLARKKGFSHLTEKDVAQIVSDIRGRR